MSTDGRPRRIHPTTGLTRRLASWLAAAAVVMGVALAAPAQADEGGLVLKVTTDGLIATFEVSSCSDKATKAEYSISDTSGNVLVPVEPVPGWNKNAAFEFTWRAEASGTYEVTVRCDDTYNTHQVATKQFTVTAKTSTRPTSAGLTIAPDTWRKGDKVTLTATGLPAGQTVKFYFAPVKSLEAIEAWDVKANGSGVASVTVPWPESGFFFPTPAEPGTYVVGVRIESDDDSLAELPVYLGSDRVWRLNQTGDKGQGDNNGLPKTGD